MNIEQIVGELQAERDRLNIAIIAMSAVANQPRRGRPPKAIQKAARPNRRRRMSAAAKKRISQAQKKRWAALRKKRAKAA